MPPVYNIYMYIYRHPFKELNNKFPNEDWLWNVVLAVLSVQPMYSGILLPQARLLMAGAGRTGACERVKLLVFIIGR